MTTFALVEGFRARRIGEQRNGGISNGHHIGGTICRATGEVEDPRARTPGAFHPLLSIEVVTLPYNSGK